MIGIGVEVGSVAVEAAAAKTEARWEGAETARGAMVNQFEESAK